MSPIPPTSLFWCSLAVLTPNYVDTQSALSILLARESPFTHWPNKCTATIHARTHFSPARTTHLLSLLLRGTALLFSLPLRRNRSLTALRKRTPLGAAPLPRCSGAISRTTPAALRPRTVTHSTRRRRSAATSEISRGFAPILQGFPFAHPIIGPPRGSPFARKVFLFSRGVLNRISQLSHESVARR